MNRRVETQVVELDERGAEFRTRPFLDQVVVSLNLGMPDGSSAQSTAIAAIVSPQQARKIVRSLLATIERAEKWRDADRLMRRRR